MDKSVTLNGQNHLGVIDRIVGLLGRDKFNMLVERVSVEEEAKSPLKFCARQISGSALRSALQVSVPLIPGGSIAWDIKVEFVVVRFEENGDVVISRFWEKQNRTKVIFLTKNPI